MTFPTNNLPTQSKYWGREVEKKITNLESSLRSSEINNTTRDSQLSVTAGQALIASNQATAAAAEASAAAAEAQAAANNAQSAINGLVSLGSDGSAYSVAADNINAGTITGVSITGGSLNTVPDNQSKSISIAGSGASFLSGGSSVGNIQADSVGRVAVFSNNGIYLSGQTGVFNGGFSSEGSISTNTGNITTGSGDIISTSGEVKGSYVTATNTVSGTSLSGGSLSVSGNSDLQGRIISAGTYGATASSSANLLINSNNFFQRSTSSRRYKSDIQDIDYGMAGLELRPRTWVDKSAYEENGNSAEGLTRITGFIAEELHDLGLTELVQYNEDGTPEAVNYDRMTVLVVPILKQQQQLIEQLTARIEALESR